MSDWRERLSGSGSVEEISADCMAATRIMKGIGAQYKSIGAMCSRLGIPYDPEETPFQRAVRIFREVYSIEASLIDVIDAKSGKRPDDQFDDWLEDTHSGIVFFRYSADGARMTSFVKGLYLCDTALGKVVIKPGIRYVASKNGMQLWEQDPVRLIKSFSKIQQEE